MTFVSLFGDFMSRILIRNVHSFAAVLLPGKFFGAARYANRRYYTTGSDGLEEQFVSLSPVSTDSSGFPEVLK
jgi:hypothetical protein